ncbi:MAG: T9SS type A sorting domain-containing protein, partial [Bacteroidales bacterium]
LDENPTNYTLRVRYNPASLKQESIAQGICYATRPEGGSPSQPNENNTILLKKGKAQEIAYFNLEACIKDGYNNQTRDIRSFILTKDGQYLLDSVFSINFRFGDKYDKSLFCQTLPAQLYIPYNFMEQSDVTLKMWEIPFNVVMTEGYVNILEGYNFFSITAHENAPDTIVVRSPLLIQTGALYPQIKFSLTKQRLDNAGELRPLHNINVYAQNATNKEKFYIGTIAARKMSDTNTERLYSFNTKVAGDSIYLLFEMQNSSDLLMVDQFEIKDDPSFTVQTKPIEVLPPNLQGQKQRLSFKGNYILDVSLPPVLEAGFIYTTGEPLVAGGPAYGDTTERKWDTIRATPNADGVFSITFDYPIYSNIYVRAYVKNALSFALSSPQMAKAYYGDYTVFSEYLPVKDSRKIERYRTSIRHTQYGEEILLNKWNREDIDLMVSANLYRPRKNFCELGRLQITHRPILNKIKVNAVIGVEASNALSPEAILPTLAIYYKTKISSAEGEMDYWNNLDSSQYTITFLEKSKPFLGSDIVTFFFTLEAYFPRDLERIAAECDKQWEIIFSNKEGGRGDHGGGILYSESNIRDSKATAPSIEYLTVENNKIQLYWQISNLTNVNAMRVYRESNQLGVYELLKEYPLSMLQSLSGVFQDTNARPDRRAYAYILKSVNSEGTEFASMPHKSIHLSINKGLQNQWNLSWTPYEGRTIASTSVYRGSAMDTLQFLEQIPGTNHTYTDVEASEKVLFYRIETKFTSPKFSKSISAKTTSTPSSLSNIVNNANKPLTTEYQVSYTQPLYGEIDVLFNNQKVTSGTYLDSASNLTLRVRPNEGYTFDSWWDGNRNINRNYLLTSDIQIRVNLVSNTQKKQYKVFFEQPINGEIEITNYTNIFPGNYYTFDSASILQLKAIPNTNYKLKSWWDGKTEVKRTYLISSDVNINAFFEKKIAIENQAIHSLFKVYPNPVKGTLYIQNHSSFSISQIELTDTKGFIKIVAPSVSANYTNLDLQSLSKGLYILRIYTSEGILIYKIAKQ